MQLNQDSKMKMMRALFHPDYPIQSASNSPVQYFVELSRPLIGLIKGICFEGFFGSIEDPNSLASKESKRLAYEIRQTLGIKGFVLNLAGSASLTAGLPACWDAVRPCLATPEFEDAAAQILTEASSLAEGLGETHHKSSLRLNPQESSDLQTGLDFYHFLLPKMLVLTSALRLACDQALFKKGIVEGHFPEQTAVGEDGLHGLFQDIRGILTLSHLQGAVSTPGAWPKYLAAASAQFKPVVQGESYHRASTRLHKMSRQLAAGFQDQISLGALNTLEAIAPQVSKLDTVLPSLIISISLLELYFRPADSLAPARPAPSRHVPKVRSQTAPERQVTHRPIMAISYPV